MKLTTFCMKPGSGWALPKPSSFNSSRTLIVASVIPFISTLSNQSIGSLKPILVRYCMAVSADENFGIVVSNQSLVVGEVEFERTDLQSGFYSCGETAPLINDPCDLHNQTMILSTICEA